MDGSGRWQCLFDRVRKDLLVSTSVCLDLFEELALLEVFKVVQIDDHKPFLMVGHRLLQSTEPHTVSTPTSRRVRRHLHTYQNLLVLLLILLGVHGHVLLQECDALMGIFLIGHRALLGSWLLRRHRAQARRTFRVVTRSSTVDLLRPGPHVLSLVPLTGRPGHSATTVSTQPALTMNGQALTLTSAAEASVPRRNDLGARIAPQAGLYRGHPGPAGRGRRGRPASDHPARPPTLTHPRSPSMRRPPPPSRCSVTPRTRAG
eukprot:scaffold6092_cov359-Prasinococcus_capsulatus_cf.AAC.1